MTDERQLALADRWPAAFTGMRGDRDRRRVKEVIDEIAPGGPSYKAERILEIVEGRVQFLVDHNGCLFPEEKVARKMLALSFVQSRMEAAADEMVRGFEGHATENGEVFVQIRRPKHYMGDDLAERITGVVISEDDGDPVVAMGMKL